jgi:hypothetical protein
VRLVRRRAVRLVRRRAVRLVRPRGVRQCLRCQWTKYKKGLITGIKSILFWLIFLISRILNATKTVCYLNAVIQAMLQPTFIEDLLELIANKDTPIVGYVLIKIEMR